MSDPLASVSHRQLGPRGRMQEHKVFDPCQCSRNNTPSRTPRLRDSSGLYKLLLLMRWKQSGWPRVDVRVQ
eukprot:1267166-Rhodomonas_salina.1